MKPFPVAANVIKVYNLLMAIKPTPIFTRLLIYFLIVMLIPMILIAFYFSAVAREDVTSNVKKEAQLYIGQSADSVSSTIEEYRHKAYLLSTNESVENAVREPGNADYRSIAFQQMFSIMQGDSSLATGSVINLNGKARLSTHVFPSQYDLRYNTNAKSPFADFSALSDNSSRMTLDWRYTTSSNQTAILNIMRKIVSASGNDLGYAVVDVYLEAFSQAVPSGFFSELVLINMESYNATSLMAPDRWGSLSNFEGIDVSQVGEPYLTPSGSIVISRPIPNTSFIISGVVNTAPYLSGLSRTFYALLLFMGIGVMAAVLAALFFSRSISSPVRRLSQAMKKAEDGHLDVTVPSSRIWEINQLDHSFNTMIAQISALLKLKAEEEEKIRISERKALEAQINPHFLYNTLNAIKSIAKLHGETEILTIVVQLGKLLRSSINNAEDTTTLRSSFELVQSYLKIQQIRFSDKLEVTIDVDPQILDIRTPKLIIQPFVENAIVHGLEPKIGEWKLKIHASIEQGNVIISVSDNGVGFDDSTFKSFDSLKDSEHNGIYNVWRRIQIHYSGKADLSIRSVVGEGTTTTITIPAQAQS